MSIDLRSHCRSVRTMPWRLGVPERNGKVHRLALRREFGLDKPNVVGGRANSNRCSKLITSVRSVVAQDCAFRANKRILLLSLA
jgi:hypothetical protein